MGNEEGVAVSLGDRAAMGTDDLPAFRRIRKRRAELIDLERLSAISGCATLDVHRMGTGSERPEEKPEVTKL